METFFKPMYDSQATFDNNKVKMTKINSQSQDNPFQNLANRYDKWFDSPRGKEIFSLEVACLQRLIGNLEGRWLEVGVGTGRFAKALGIKEGIDPAQAVLKIAADRGIKVKLARAENTPYPAETFDGLLMVVTICFLDNPAEALGECYRILKQQGRLIIGLVPADSSWGRFYAEKGRDNHPFYSAAKFYTCQEVIELANKVGPTFYAARSCLFDPPEEIERNLSKEIHPGTDPSAGFVAMDFRKV
ncbi:MAG: class I SAM-dependent methyltransferase [Planctomycetes bacterium]|nr:class I SAM-dependent methyltransferase [Planctomycetota bacterium]